MATGMKMEYLNINQSCTVSFHGGSDYHNIALVIHCCSKSQMQTKGKQGNNVSVSSCDLGFRVNHCGCPRAGLFKV